jgi:hypothetical protein
MRMQLRRHCHRLPKVLLNIHDQTERASLFACQNPLSSAAFETVLLARQNASHLYTAVGEKMLKCPGERFALLLLTFDLIRTASGS